LINEFWCNVVHCAAKGSPTLVNGVRGPAEVTQLNVHPLQVGDQNILWFDVSMNHVAVLEVKKRLYDLSNYVFAALLGKAFLAP